MSATNSRCRPARFRRLSSWAAGRPAEKSAVPRDSSRSSSLAIVKHTKIPAILARYVAAWRLPNKAAAFRGDIMIAMKNVMVATDFGEAADAALRYGRELAGRFGATLHLVHVVE